MNNLPYSVLETCSELSKIIRSQNGVAQGKAPLASVLLCTYNTPPEILRETINSVLAQDYPRIEICIVDDGSKNSDTLNTLSELDKEHPDILLTLMESNQGISKSTDQAIASSSGQFLAFLDHDDILATDAISTCIMALIKDNADIVYTDQATIDDSGKILHCFFKPSWSPEYFRHVMYVGHLVVASRSAIIRAGAFDSSYDGVQDFEYILRASELSLRISHVSRVLYYWRAIEGSLAKAKNAKSNIPRLQAQSVQAHLGRTGISGTACSSPSGNHRTMIIPQASASAALISIIIPTKDSADLLEQCLSSIFSLTTYQRFEVILVDTGTTCPDAITVMSRYPIHLIEFHNKPFNFSKACNHGAFKSEGEFLLFLNNDTQVITPGWLEELLHPLQYDDVAISGPMLLYPNGTVQHAGVVLGARGTADHVMRGFPSDSDGYSGSLSCSREVSAVTGACLAIKRDVFISLDGFSDLYFTHYQDVDLCLKARAQGFRCIYTPNAKLYHHESISRGGYYDMIDRHLFIDTWRSLLAHGDPYFNKAFSLSSLDYSLEEVTI